MADAKRTRLELHLVPGHFSDAACRLIGHLTGGRGGLRLRADARRAPELARLADTGQSESRSVEAGAGPGDLTVRIETFGVPPGPRLLLGLRVESVRGRETTGSDLELLLLGLACAALAREEQGAVLVGPELGPVGAGLPRGTISEQVAALLALHGPAVVVLVTTAATARGLGPLDDFVTRPLGDLVEYRRP